jgi:hypothetical protein
MKVLGILVLSLIMVIGLSTSAFAQGTIFGGDVTVSGENATFSNVKVEQDFTVEETGSATLENVDFSPTSAVKVEGSVTIKGSTGDLKADNITVSGAGELDARDANKASIRDKNTVAQGVSTMIGLLALMLF